MAFTGVHVEFGYMKKAAANSAPILGPLVTSEDPASGIATTSGAPTSNVQGLDPMINIIAAANSWVTIGPSPADPSLSASPRRLAFANVPLPVFCNPGDQVRWVAA